MPDYDIVNGMASAGPVVFLIGVGMVLAFGWLVGRDRPHK